MTTMTPPSTALTALRNCRTELRAAHADAGYAAGVQGNLVERSST